MSLSKSLIVEVQIIRKPGSKLKRITLPASIGSSIKAEEPRSSCSVLPSQKNPLIFNLSPSKVRTLAPVSLGLRKTFPWTRRESVSESYPIVRKWSRFALALTIDPGTSIGLGLIDSFFWEDGWSGLCRVSGGGFSVEESAFSSLPTVRDGVSFVSGSAAKSLAPPIQTRTPPWLTHSRKAPSWFSSKAFL